MTAHDDPHHLPNELENLERRIQDAQDKTRPVSTEPIRPGLGRAFKLATEFFSAVVVGASLGWLLDQWFKTSPLMLLVCFALGITAGFLNVFRAARTMNDSGADGSEGKK